MTTLYELLTLRKSAVVIPLPRSASRGDQIENAALLEGLGLVTVLEQSRLAASTLNAAILDAYNLRARRAVAIGALQLGEGTAAVVQVVQDVLDGNADKNSHFAPDGE
jgi:UDP-N-acetylglucosamine--N-acetylmuramyl-(pentapeptide) pyrophosphoryl-undecaprenol N-acetylglucosamine transferase